MTKSSHKTLMRKLDRVFSMFVRLRDTNEEGIGRCITCKKFIQIRTAEAGHWKKRQILALRFNEDNIATQCSHCNNWLQGNDNKFKDALINKLGIARVEVLDYKAAAGQATKFYPFELEEMIGTYTLKCLELLRKKEPEVKDWVISRLEAYIGKKKLKIIRDS